MTPVLFSTIEVSRQVFFRTATTAAIVNLKPIIPGHVLVIPTRPVARLADLSPAEVSSLFSSVQLVGKVIEKVYKADALTIACQDGKAAGQSIPHVHIHILPRKLKGDQFANNDDVYPAIESNEQELGKHLDKKQEERSSLSHSNPPSSSQPALGEPLRVDNDNRRPRTPEEMEEEALWLKGHFEQQDS